jgi:hypothetical protein
MLRTTAIFVLLFMPVQGYGAEYQALGAGYRFLGLPDFTVTPTFAAHQPVMAHGASLHYAQGRWDSHWLAGITGGGMAVAAGYWQAAGAEPHTAIFTEFDVGFLGGYVAYSWSFLFFEKLVLSPTVGAGVAGVLGEVYATEVLPGCTSEAAECGHWRRVTRAPVPFESRFLPLLLASASLAYQVSDDLRLGLEAGFLNLPFVGISAEYIMGGE